MRGGRSISEASELLSGFAPVLGRGPRILILGSMPGSASLDAMQYYAMPRNAFWPIMEALFGAGFALPYPQRLEKLKQNRVALWDVLGSCIRPGSLDASIDMRSIVVNDFSRLLAENPGIDRVFFNGKKAAELFGRHVVPKLSAKHSALQLTTLPSTSPAHAAMNFADKLAAWQVVHDAIQT